MDNAPVHIVVDDREKTGGKVVAALLQRPYADVLEEPIRDLRISFGTLEMRLLYFILGKSIVVTHGFL